MPDDWIVELQTFDGENNGFPMLAILSAENPIAPLMRLHLNESLLKGLAIDAYRVLALATAADPAGLHIEIEEILAAELRTRRMPANATRH